MKEELKIKEEESLCHWIDRIQKYYCLSKEIREVMREISITSYTRGSNAALEIVENRKK